MKTILLLMCGLCLISQVSFGKEINTNASVGKKDIKLERVTFNTSSVSKKSIEEQNRIWLNLTNAGGAFKQLLVGYVTGATNDLDRLYDGFSTDSNPYVDFYSINSGKNLTIQGRGLPFLTTDEVPLGYKTNIVGTFNITIDEVDGLFVSRDIFLKDLVTGVTHNLKNGTYSFTTLAGRFNERFVLLYVNTAATEPVPPLDPIVVVPEVPVPVVSDPVVTIPEVPVPVVTDPIVIVPEVPAPVVTDPIVTVPEIPAPIVIDPIVVVPEIPVPIVTDPIVTVPEVQAPVVTDPVVIVPEVPAPVVTVPIVTVPEVPAPIVNHPIVTVPEFFVVADNVRNFNGKGKPVIVSVDNNQITISSTGDEINEIYVYTMGNKQLFQRRNVNTNEYVIADLGVAKQVLIIKTQLKNGKWVNSKIIL